MKMRRTSPHTSAAGPQGHILPSKTSPHKAVKIPHWQIGAGLALQPGATCAADIDPGDGVTRLMVTVRLPRTLLNALKGAAGARVSPLPVVYGLTGPRALATATQALVFRHPTTGRPVLAVRSPSFEEAFDLLAAFDVDAAEWLHRALTGQGAEDMHEGSGDAA